MELFEWLVGGPLQLLLKGHSLGQSLEVTAVAEKHHSHVTVGLNTNVPDSLKGSKQQEEHLSQRLHPP